MLFLESVIIEIFLIAEKVRRCNLNTPGYPILS